MLSVQLSSSPMSKPSTQTYQYKISEKQNKPSMSDIVSYLW